MRGRIAVVVITLWLCAGCTAPETHLIPESYKGDVFIVSGVPDGEPAQREWFRIVFKIPENGILFTQDEPSKGWHTFRYYYVDSSGKRRLLDLEASTVHRTPENLADTRPFVWFPRSVTHGELHYTQYYVGTRADMLTRKHDTDELRFRQYVEQRNGHP